MFWQWFRCFFQLYIIMAMSCFVNSCAPPPPEEAGSKRDAGQAMLAGEDGNDEVFDYEKEDPDAEEFRSLEEAEPEILAEEYSMLELNEMLTNRKDQLKNDKITIDILETIRIGLCGRYKERKEECLVIQPLTEYYVETVQCTESGDADQEYRTEIKSQLTGIGSLEYKLIANSTWETDLLEGGVLSDPITFSSSTGADENFIIQDINSLIIDFGGNDIDINDVNFKLIVNGVEVLKRVSSIPDNTKQLKVNLGEIVQLAKSPSCRISQNQINAIKAKVSKAVKETAHKENLRALKSQSYSSDKVSVAQEILTTQLQISAIDSNKNLLRNSVMKLEQELRKGQHMGCKINERITELIMRFQGSTESATITQATRPPNMNCTDSKPLVRIMLGDGAAIRSFDKDISGYLAGNDLNLNDVIEGKSYLIGALNSLRLEQVSSCYACTCTEAQDPCEADYQCTITNNTVSLQSVQVIANGVLVIDRQGDIPDLHHKANSQESYLSTGDIRSKDAWIALELREDCG